MGASLKVAWNAGELSPLLDGRTDLAKYAHGCSVLLNEIPTVHGPVYRRPGTRFVADCGSYAPVLVPFVFNRTQPYVLAIGNPAGIAVYADRGRVLDEDDDPYWFGSGIWSTPPRRADGTSRISYTQSGDTLFVCDADGELPCLAITRKDHDDWSIAPYEMTNPPREDWRNGLCLLYKKKADGTVAPDGQYYLCVDAGAITSGHTVQNPDTISESLDEAINLTVSSDMATNYFSVRRRGKVVVNLGAKVYDDYTWGSYAGYNHIENVSKICGWFYSPTTQCYEGRLVSHLGRIYLATGPVLFSKEPTHESQIGGTAGKLKYIGNGEICFDIIESGIEDEAFDSNGSAGNIFVALVKPSICPDNEERLSGELFDTLVAMPGIAFTQKTACAMFKCHAWAPASVRDYIPEVMVTPLPNIGEVPDNVTIFRERLVLSVNRNLHASVAGDFPNFSALDGAGQVVADCALDLDLLAGDLSPVSWMAPAQKLVLGSFGGERAIGEQNLANAFGPTNVKVDVSSSQGSRDIPPAIIGSDVLFVDRSGRRVRRSGLALDPQDAADLSILAEHIGAESPFIDSAWQLSPSSVLWLAQADGGLCGLTYDRSQDVVAWHRHDLGGDVLAICSIPSPDGTRDDLWLVVERVFGATTKIYLEVMPDDFTLGRAVADQCFLDCSLTYSGTATTTITGLTHLAGATVQVLANGSAIKDLTVSAGGVLTLPSAFTKVHVGLNHPARIRTMRLEKSPDGVSQGKIGRIHKVVLRLMDSVGVKLGPTFTKMDRKEFRDASMQMDTAVPIQTIDLACDFPGDYDGANYVCIEQDQPLPLTILSASIEFGIQS